MEKIELGRSGLAVTRLCFDGVSLQNLTEEDAIALVRRCLDLGINFIDTARTYSASEEWIGKAVSGRREGVVLATKSLSRRADALQADLEQSLERLSVERIDLFQFQMVDVLSEYEQVAGVLLPVVEEAKREGKVGHIGITTYDMRIAREAVESGRFETLAFPFNLVTCEAAEQLLPLCRERGVGFIATNPTALGLLGNDRIAFRYLLQFPDVVVLPSVVYLHEIEEIIGAAGGPPELTEAERRDVRRLSEELGAAYCCRGGCCS